MGDESTKPELKLVPEKSLDEEEAEFRKFRRDLPGVKGAAAVGIVTIGVSKIPGKKRVLPHTSYVPSHRSNSGSGGWDGKAVLRCE